MRITIMPGMATERAGVYALDMQSAARLAASTIDQRFGNSAIERPFFQTLSKFELPVVEKMALRDSLRVPWGKSLENLQDAAARNLWIKKQFLDDVLSAVRFEEILPNAALDLPKTAFLAGLAADMSAFVLGPDIFNPDGTELAYLPPSFLQHHRSGPTFTKVKLPDFRDKLFLRDRIPNVPLALYLHPNPDFQVPGANIGESLIFPIQTGFDTINAQVGTRGTVFPFARLRQ